jgi:hypothetical protein
MEVPAEEIGDILSRIVSSEIAPDRAIEEPPS